MEKKIFNLCCGYKPMGDQPRAISELVRGIKSGRRSQVLLGVTGSGKTFTMANVIAQIGRPALIMAPNKILAAQLYTEMKSFFPNNHVEYFVSYYDYYQPEAYMPVTDTYIDKDASINEQLDRMRHSATRAMLEEKDVIIVSSVSSIYGIGAPEQYSKMKMSFNTGDIISISTVQRALINIQYKRDDISFVRGSFRIHGDILDLFPSHSLDKGWRLSFFGDKIDEIWEFDSLTGVKLSKLDRVIVYPNTHYAVPIPSILQAMSKIRMDLESRLNFFHINMKYVEEQRLRERVNFDIEMMENTGTCRGIENYSRYLSGRLPGYPPPTLFEYLPKNALLFVDESHVTVPQIMAMARGDRARKDILSQYGFRLPSCIDNRPLTFEEWDFLRPQTVFVSATPAEWEISQTKGVVTEQIIRPTGLLDPVCVVKPIECQVDDLLNELKQIKGRALVITLTKKMAEQLTDYLVDNGIRAKYLHSDIETLERIELLRDLRLGEYDVLVGINLLREGLDVPECELVAILDADKEGFLRSVRSLIQTIGRAARNANGRVVLYADKMTESINIALTETARRRKIQNEYNIENHITPKTVVKSVFSEVVKGNDKSDKKMKFIYNKNGVMDVESLRKEVNKLTVQMRICAENLEFEKAATIRDTIHKLEDDLLLLE